MIDDDFLVPRIQYLLQMRPRDASVLIQLKAGWRQHDTDTRARRDLKQHGPPRMDTRRLDTAQRGRGSTRIQLDMARADMT